MPHRDPKTVGSVAYHAAGKSYTAKRELKRHAGTWSLWALAVGMAISGSFVGWHFGLAEGGFGGLLIATVIISVMYGGLCFSVAEMASALPHAGGAYGFARAALGPWGGLVTGLSQTLQAVMVPAVVVVGIGGYLGAIFETPDEFAPIWWLFAYVLFVGFNVWGAEVAFRAALVLTGLALAVLLVFALGALPHFSWDLALDILPDYGRGNFLPNGALGIAFALPFAVWFYLAVDLLPLASEESPDPQRTMPKAIVLALLTLLPIALLVLFLNTGIAPGAEEIGASEEPLFLGLQTVLGAAVGPKVLMLLVLAGLIASFHAVIFAYGRNIYALSRAGYLPHWLSVTHGARKTPHVALIAGAGIGYLAALLIHFSEALFGDFLVGGILLNMAIFGAVFSYALQSLSFILLRDRLPDLERPYRSPLDLPGAWLALAIALITLLFLLLNPDYRIGLWGCVIGYALAALYFAVHGRKTLVYAPEERSAIAANSDRKPKSLKTSEAAP